MKLTTGYGFPFYPTAFSMLSIPVAVLISGDEKRTWMNSCDLDYHQLPVSDVMLRLEM